MGKVEEAQRSSTWCWVYKTFRSCVEVRFIGPLSGQQGAESLSFHACATEYHTGLHYCHVHLTL